MPDREHPRYEPGYDPGYDPERTRRDRHDQYPDDYASDEYVRDAYTDDTVPGRDPYDAPEGYDRYRERPRDRGVPQFPAGRREEFLDRDDRPLSRRARRPGDAGPRPPGRPGARRAQAPPGEPDRSRRDRSQLDWSQGDRSQGDWPEPADRPGPAPAPWTSPAPRGDARRYPQDPFAEPGAPARPRASSITGPETPSRRSSPPPGRGRGSSSQPPMQSFRQPKGPPPGRRRAIIIAASLVVLLFVGAVTYAAVGRGHSSGSPSVVNPAAEISADPGSDSGAKAAQKPVKTTGAEKKVKLGLFRGTSPSSINQFSDWLGRDVQYAVDYSTRATWAQVSNPSYTLGTWAGSDYRMVYGVVMLPTRDDSATLAAGADGDYDHYFRTLAQNLVARGQGDAIIRLAWEFNVSKGNWSLTAADQKDFVAYWRNIVTAMRSVAGAEKLQFDWNVNNGGETYDSTIFYPGNKYVDYVGVDVYDISWDADTYPYPAGCTGDCLRAHQEAAWSNIFGAGYGLAFWADFARLKKKPLSLPEWGLWDRSDTDGHGGVDDPYFIQQMHDFIDDPRNNVAYQAYFDVNPDDKGKHQLSEMPKGQARFRKVFGH